MPTRAVKGASAAPLRATQSLSPGYFPFVMAPERGRSDLTQRFVCLAELFTGLDPAVLAVEPFAVQQVRAGQVDAGTRRANDPSGKAKRLFRTNTAPCRANSVFDSGARVIPDTGPQMHIALVQRRAVPRQTRLNGSPVL